MQKDKLYIEKGISIYFLYIVITAFISGEAALVWFACDLYGRVKTLENEQKEYSVIPSELTKLDTQLTDFKDNITRIDKSLDTLVNRALK